MKLKINFAVLLLLSLSFSCAAAQPQMTILGEFDVRPGNLAVAQDDTIYFSNSPFGSPEYKVMKLVDGKATPYPSDAMSKSFANVIGIRIEKNGTLWILDMGNEDNSPKLIGWNTIENKMTTVCYLPKESYVANSFLQDMAIDEVHRKAYLADMTRSGAIDSSSPAVVVVDLETGAVRRVLEGHSAFQADDEVYMTAEGKPMLFSDANGKLHKLQYGLNPITIDPQNKWVYFAPLTKGTIFRVPANILANMNATDAEVAKAIEPYAKKPASDGMIVDENGNVFVTNVDKNAISVANSHGTSIWFQDDRLIWPDGIEFTPDGSLVVTVTQLSRLPAFNAGIERGEPPFTIVKIEK